MSRRIRFTSAVLGAVLAPQSDGKIYYMLFDPAECVSVREGAE